MSEIEDDILKLLQERNKEMFITEIGKSLNTSPTTVSKYLRILEARGKVESNKKMPYIYWRIKKNGE